MTLDFRPSTLDPQLSQAELIIANFFITNWLVTLYVTPARIGYLFGYESIIDITTCIPVYLSICRAAQNVGKLLQRWAVTR